MSDRDRLRHIGDEPLSNPASRWKRYLPTNGGAQSLPSSVRLAASSVGGELARMRSFFLDVESPASAQHAPHPSASGHSLVAAPDAANATTRLEVLKALEVNITIFALYGATVFALVYVVIVSYFARLSWEDSGTLAKGPVLDAISRLLRGAVNVAFFVLPIFFAVRVAVSRRVANEQIWTAALLFTGLFCENPLTDLLSSLRTLRRAAIGDVPGAAAASFVGAGKGHGHAGRLVLYDATYTVAIYLYMLLSAHSYRLLNANDYTRAFYLPKLVAGASYFCVKLVLGYLFRVALGVVPFSRVLVLYYLQSSGRSSLRLAFPIIVTTVLDSIFAIWVVREVSATAYFLARVPYLENRAKQLGFRCFVFQSIQLITNMLVVSVLLEVSLPREVLYRSYDWAIGHSHRFIQIEPAVGQLALAVIYLTWNVIIAYVNLPPGPIVPFTGTALSKLAQHMPSAISDRTRWPLWMPFAVASEPSDVDTESDDDGSPVMLSSLNTGGPNATSEGLHMSAEDAAAHERAQAEAAAAAESWRAGIPGGEACPLRYRHREWHEVPTLECPPMALLGSDPSISLGNPVYSGELETADDLVMEHTAIGFDHSHFVEEENRRDEDLFSARTVSVPIGSPVERYRAPLSVSPETSARLLESPYMGGSGGLDYTALARLMSPPPVLPNPAGLGRLLTRKNVFVMETQIMMANAMYLCYIPGNRKEELPREVSIGGAELDRDKNIHSNLGSLTDDLDELEAQIEYENKQTTAEASPAATVTSAMHPDSPPSKNFPGRDWELEHDLGTGSNTFSAGIRPVSSVPNVADADRQPEYDDGSMFLVDPTEMAAKHGYLLYRHIRHDASNGHAIVLVGPDRVIVAFSGTRDRKNWVTNSRFMRAPWDEMFRHFDSEPSDTLPDNATDATAQSSPAYSRGDEARQPSAQRSGVGLETPHPKSGKGVGGGQDTATLVRRSDPRADLSAKDSSRRHSGSVHGLNEGVAVAGRDEKVSLSRNGTGHGSFASLRQSEAIPLMRRSRSVESLNLVAGGASMHDEDLMSGAPSSYGSTRNFKPDMSPRHRRSSSLNRGQSWFRTALQQPRPRPGASEFEDVAVSLARELATYGHSKVHLGFAQAYGKLRNRVMGALLELYGGKVGGGASGGGPMDSFASRSGTFSGPVFERDSDGKPIGVERGSCRGLPLFIVGHSLGGVLATFASYEVARYYRRIGLRRRQDVACTTFGSPMPGNTVFKERYERMVETHWRFEFASDPVAKLPGILNYTPVGVRVLLDQSGWLLVDPSLVEVKWWGRLAGPYLGARLHIRASYIKALQVFCSRHKGGEDPLTGEFWPFPITCQTQNLFPTV